MKTAGLALALVLSAMGTLYAAEPNSSPAAAPPASEVALLAAPAPWFLAVTNTTNCSADTETNYYTDATKTTLVGHCTITCRQFVLGSADPTFGGGGTGTGMSSGFAYATFHTCTCPP